MTKTNSDKYQKLTHKEHVLLRPNIYVGSIVGETKSMFVVDDIKNINNIKIVSKSINYNAGFLKIFDEILTNASDHSIRTNQVKYIRVDVNKEWISVENDGPGIPVEIHDKEKIYIPELLFGHLMAGSNFNKDDERVWGGQNGMGCTLTNIFSKKFIIETCDGKKKYEQVFENNLNKINKPKIKASKKQYTKIIFYPDFARFDLNGIDEEIESIFIKRCIDVSVYCSKVKVYYNGVQIPTKNFKSYMEMFVGEHEIFYEKLDDKWEIGISKSLDNSFNQISMVNGISTYNGGTHVNSITNQITKKVQEALIRKNKKLNIKQNDIKNHLFVFVNTKVVNPVFDTQSKENLISKVSAPDISDGTIKKIVSSQMIDELMKFLMIKEEFDTKKEIGKHKIKISKLEDAPKAGTSESSKCLLFLTEGDCLQEDTFVTIVRNGEKMKIRIKDIKLNDAVITHNNNIGLINNISKKIEKVVKIKLKNDDVILCSENHRWYIYNKETNNFSFVKTKDIDISKHKMIINKNSFYDNLIKIKDIVEYDDKKYDNIVMLEDGVEILSTNQHKFSVFNINNQSFEMIKCCDLNKNVHFIVSYEKL